jgi:hypothetical protein
MLLAPSLIGKVEVQIMAKNTDKSILSQFPTKPILNREDLSFTSRDDKDFLLGWDVPHDKNGCWHEGIEIGLQHFAEVAELAHASEYQAFIAIQCAMNNPGWKTTGWGIEIGFSKGIAAAAIVGLRALQAGAAPYDHEAEWRKLLEADDGAEQQ